MDTPLFQQASGAARENVYFWIQSTLREVALQSLKHSFVQRQLGDPVQRAKESCKRVATKWKERLIAVGHNKVAEQIQHVVDTWGENLYYSSCPSAEAPAIAGSEIPTSEKPTESTTEPISKTRRKRKAMTMLGRLYQFEGDGINDMIEQLDEWGRSGQTDWPFDWSVIEEMCKAIPNRLYQRRSNGEEEEIVHIPKHLWEKHRTEAPDGTNVVTMQERERQQVLSKFRRKKAPKPPTRKHYEAPPETPRPPSMQSESMQLDFRRGWTASELAQLDACVHSGDVPPADILVLGALAEIGRYHHAQQLPIYYSEADLAQMSHKQKLSAQRASIKQRLGDHKEVDENATYGRSKRKSRVLATADAQNWYDFDLSHCLLEVGGEQKELLAFSHLDVILLDEDKAEHVQDSQSRSSEEQTL